MCGKLPSTDRDGRIGGKLIFPEGLPGVAVEVKVVRDERLPTQVDLAETSRELRPGGHSTASLLGCRHFDERSADRPANRAFNERDLLVLEQHRPREGSDTRSVIYSVLNGDSSLRPRLREVLGTNAPKRSARGRAG